MRVMKNTANLVFSILRWSLYVSSLLVLFCRADMYSEKPVKQPEENVEMSRKSIADVLKTHTQDLMALPGVVGTGQGLHEGKPCIKVFVTKCSPELEKQIPKQLEKYPVVIEETGVFKTFPQDTTGKKNQRR